MGDRLSTPPVLYGRLMFSHSLVKRNTRQSVHTYNTLSSFHIEIAKLMKLLENAKHGVACRGDN